MSIVPKAATSVIGSTYDSPFTHLAQFSFPSHLLPRTYARQDIYVVAFTEHSTLTHLSFHSASIMDPNYDLDFDFDIDFDFDLALFGQTEQQHPWLGDDLPTFDMGPE
jgi:hypothetical protein